MNPRKSRPPGNLAGALILFVLGAVVCLVFLFGCEQSKKTAPPAMPDQIYDWCDYHPADELCVRALAERAEDAKVSAWMAAVTPWSIGFLILATLAGLVWYFRAFSRLAFIGERIVQVCGSERAAMRLIAQLEADNAARLAGALSAAAFGVGRSDAPREPER